ncbi:MAG: GlsB/YeaQ/YmgE family stress response membrane protein [Actinobacteria bacterium]|nr:MAG: GlsB/YeaQ/YmgE family stress response membrane protein [Actinomycetota bacterium]
MGLIGFIVLLIVGGLIIGALGRLVIPGPNPMSIAMTIAVGIGGSLLGGIIGKLIFGRPGGFLLAVLSSALIVWLIQRSQTRRTTAL